MIVWAYTNRRYEYQRKKLCRTVEAGKAKRENKMITQKEEKEKSKEITQK